MYEKISIRDAIENAHKSSSGKWELRKGKGLPTFIEAPRNENIAYGLDVCGEDYTCYGEEEQREVNMRVMTRSREMALFIEEAEKHLKRYAEICMSSGRTEYAASIVNLLKKIDEK